MKTANASPSTTTPTAAEIKQQKLVKLANARMNRAIKAISLVGNLGTYGPTSDQVTQIVGTLQAAVDTVNTRLQPTKATPEVKGFTLS